MTPQKLPLDSERLAALVFELYSQLQAERAHRLTLEAALLKAGALSPGDLERLANDAQLRERCRIAADESVAKLMRVLTEATDERTPLRSESTKQGD